MVLASTLWGVTPMVRAVSDRSWVLGDVRRTLGRDPSIIPRLASWRQQKAGRAPSAARFLCRSGGLQSRADAAQDAVDGPARDTKGRDRKDCDEREDESVLGQALALLESNNHWFS